MREKKGHLQSASAAEAERVDGDEADDAVAGLLHALNESVSEV